MAKAKFLGNEDMGAAVPLRVAIYRKIERKKVELSVKNGEKLITC